MSPIDVRYTWDWGPKGSCTIEVTSTSTVPFILVLTSSGGYVSPAQVIEPGQTVSFFLGPVDPGDSVSLMPVGDPEDSRFLFVMRFCSTQHDVSVSIAANTSYTLNLGAGPNVTSPQPAHGTVTRVNYRPGVGWELRYTPDPCYSGTDQFGYNDWTYALHGVVTVTVRPGPCLVTVRRTSFDCGSGIVGYTATNPYAAAATIRIRVGGLAPASVRDVRLAAHTTKAIYRIDLSSSAAGDVTVSFNLVSPAHALLSETVTVPCGIASTPGTSASTPDAGNGGGGLAKTGPPTATIAFWALSSVAFGLIVLGVARRISRR